VQDAGVGFQHPLEALALQTAVERGVFPQRVGFAITQPNVFDEKTGKIKLPVGMRPPLGNEYIKWNGVKMWADGSLIGRTAAMSHDYCGEPGNKGYMRIPRPELQSMVAEAHRAGWQCWTHAIGDAAVEEVVDAYEAAIKNFPRKEPARHRIEHCGLLNDGLIKRIADLGLVVVSQPRFISVNFSFLRSPLSLTFPFSLPPSLSLPLSLSLSLLSLSSLSLFLHPLPPSSTTHVGARRWLSQCFGARKDSTVLSAWYFAPTFHTIFGSIKRDYV